MKNMTERLLDLMKSRGIKGIHLAEGTSISTATISRILKGTQKPTAETLYKFAQYFNVTMEFLLIGEDSGYTMEEIKLIYYYRQMNKTDQEDLLLVAKMKAEKRKKEETPKLSRSEHNNSNTETA